MFKIPFGNFRRPFKSLQTSAAKRVRIAVDVIAQINKGIIEAKTNQYLTLPYKWREGDESCQLQSKLQSADGEKCTCCALGSMFLAKANLVNHLTVVEADNADRYDMQQSLKDWFTPTQLDLIETAFEYQSGQVFGNCTGLEKTQACVFGNRYPDPTKRLVAIMKNIIKNRGEFVP